MMNMRDLFYTTMVRAKAKEWDTLYVAIDWHDTITESTYDASTALKFYPEAIKALQLLSFIPEFKLILFTSSFDQKTNELIKVLKSHNIKIDYVNANPEVENTKFGDFRQKFYYNLLLDDKAGFQPEMDWGYIIEFALEHITKEYKV